MFSPASSLSVSAITWPQVVEALPVIISLIIIEGLLSVDNALAIAAMSAHLPPEKRTLAMRLGIGGAYPFRVLALFFANLIIQNLWLKIAGAAYLIHLLLAHFAGKVQSADDTDGSAGAAAGSAGESGVAHHHAATVGESARGFWSTVVAIQFLNLSLSVDNVVAAVAMSPKFWVVCTGVCIGILALMFLASLCGRLIEKFPVLEDAAFLLIGYVGALLIYEMATHHEVGTLGKFIGIVIILSLSLLYSQNAALQRVLAPVWRGLRWPLRGYAALLGGLALPFKMLFARRHQTAREPETAAAKTLPKAELPH